MTLLLERFWISLLPPVAAHQSIAVQSRTHSAPPGRPLGRTVIFMCNCFVVSVWEYRCNSGSLCFLASGETRRQASIAEFASSQRGPVACREYHTHSVCRVGISQLLQVRDTMETSCPDDSQGSSVIGIPRQQSMVASSCCLVSSMHI